MKNSLLLLLLLCLGYTLQAQTMDACKDKNYGVDNILHEWCYNKSVGDTKWDPVPSPYRPYIYNGMHFRLLYPKGWEENSTKKYPLLVLLHGIGEKGDDNNHQLEKPGKQHWDAWKNGKYDGFIMVPQNNTSGGLFSNTEYTQIPNFINYAIKNLGVDEFRVFAEGFSAGGTAAWNLAHRNPTMFAGIIVMSAASGTYKDWVDLLKYTAIYHSQGGRDEMPSPSTGNAVADAFKNAGANYKYNFYPDLDHGTWWRMYGEPDFFPFMMRNSMLRIHSLYFKYNFCEGEEVKGTLGIKGGFLKYRWYKDGQLLVENNSNEFPFEGEAAFGTYQVSVLRKNIKTGLDEWSNLEESEPIQLKRIGATGTQMITASGPTALPTPDGTNTVTLQAPEGFQNYQWYKDGTPINGAIYNSYLVTTAGSYTVTVTEDLGCPSGQSAPVQVTYNSNGALNAPSNLSVSALSASQLRLSWIDQSNNETGFELYRSRTQEGPWTLAAQIQANTSTYTDGGLESFTRYYYQLRAVNQQGGSAYITGNGKTKADEVPPTAPQKLEVIYTSRKNIRLRWQASTDDAAGAGQITYEVFHNNKSVLSGTTTDTTINLRNLAERQYYNFVVRAKDRMGNVSEWSNQVTAGTFINGLYYSYYEGGVITVNDIEFQTLVKTGWVSNFDIVTPRTPGRKDYFAFKYEGYINIRKAGTYTFYTRSDDGSTLRINNTLVVNNDGKHAAKEASGSIQLSEGVHAIKVLYFDETGNNEVLEVRWESANAGISKEKIPDAAFTEDMTAPTPPTAPENLQAAAVDHQGISLQWVDKSNNETGFEIHRGTSNEGTFSLIHTTAANVQSYTDSGLQPLTTYYYKIRAIAGSGESNFTGKDENGIWANATTLEESGTLAAPDNLRAERLSANSVSLQWNDNTEEETKFELYRNGVQYQLLADNTTSYTDTEAPASASYTYKVRAARDSEKSAFSNEVVVTGNDGNTAPVLAPIGTLSARYGEAASFKLMAHDSDGDPITFSHSNMPAFASLTDHGNGTASLSITAGAERGSYSDILIQIADNKGGTDAETITIQIGDNYAPGIMKINPVSLLENESITIDVSAYDGDGESLTLSLAEAPDFATFTAGTYNRGKITLKPGYAHQGQHLITVKATDPHGATGTNSFVVYVRDVKTSYQVLLNFNDHYQAQAPAPWNNFASTPTQSARIYDLKDINGEATPVDLILMETFGRGNHGSTSNSSPIFPDAVLKTYIYGWDDATRHIKLSSLNPNLTYKVSLLGSAAASNYSKTPTQYIINGEAKTLEVQENTSNTVVFDNLTPTNGEIIIGVKRTGDYQYAYINALMLEATLKDGTIPLAPGNLRAALTENNTIELQWRDNAYNEEGFQIERSLNNGAFSSIGSTGANIKTFTDTNISMDPGLTYAYRVRAANANGASDWSNVAQLTIEGTSPGDNNAPQISGFPAVVSAAAGEETRVEFGLSDPDGDALSLIARYMPPFARVEVKNESTGLIILNPAQEDVGYYTGIQLTATDGSLDTDITFSISVVNSGLTATYINMSLPGAIAGKPWNNASFTTSGTTPLISNLYNERDEQTGFYIKNKTSFNKAKLFGDDSGNNSGLYPDVVTQSAYIINKGSTASLEVGGLNPDKRYNFVFLGSNILGSNGGQTTYSIAGQSVSLAIQSNIDRTVQLNGISPSAAGVVTISVKGETDASKGGYLNALVIEEYSQEQFLRPEKLQAHAISRSEVKLSWDDKSYQETGFEIERRLLPDGEFSLIHTAAANARSHTDTGLEENTGYEYRVRTIGSNGRQSAYSAAAQAATLMYRVMINANDHTSSFHTNAPSPPWNNLDKDTQTGYIWSNLIEDISPKTPTSINLKIIDNFDGNANVGADAYGAGVYPDKVIKSLYFTEAGQLAVLGISGLDDNLAYNFRLFGSSTFGSENGVTEYRIGNKKRTLDVQGNISNTTVLRDVQPNNGAVYLELEAGAQESHFAEANGTARYGYFNAMVIEVRDAQKEFLGANTNTGARLAGEATEEATAAEQTATLYPNPVEDQLNIDFTARTAGPCYLMVTDLMGRTLYSRQVNARQGKNTWQLDLGGNSMKTGMYVLKVRTADQESKVIRFMKR